MEGIKNASSITSLSTYVEKIVLDGYPIAMILSSLEKYIFTLDSLIFIVYWDVDVTDSQKADISLILANAEKAALDGCDEELTLLSTCCSIVKIL